MNWREADDRDVIRRSSDVTGRTWMTYGFSFAHRRARRDFHNNSNRQQFQLSTAWPFFFKHITTASTFIYDLSLLQLRTEAFNLKALFPTLLFLLVLSPSLFPYPYFFPHFLLPFSSATWAENVILE